MHNPGRWFAHGGLLLVLSLLGGCASQGVDLVREGTVRVEKTRSESMYFPWVAVERQDGKDVVSGSLRWPHGSPLATSGHVDIEVRAADGQVIQMLAVPYHAQRLTGPPSTTHIGQFRAELAEPLPAGALVRVGHDTRGVDACARARPRQES